jgi:thiol-disulfide isomerase/thioredoxin
MMFARHFLPLVAGALIALSGAQAASFGTDDYTAAFAQAAKENKYILLDFTGSDWCPPCKMMAKEVFSSDEFKAFAEKNLIVVTMDFNPDGAKPGKFQDQNNYLSQRLQVQGFPTFVVLSPKSVPLAMVSGYQPGGPAAFIKWIQKAQQKAESKGKDKAA